MKVRYVNVQAIMINKDRKNVRLESNRKTNVLDNPTLTFFS